MRGPGSVVSIVAGRSGDRIPVKERFSLSVQTAHSAPIQEAFSGVKQRRWGVSHPPFSRPEVKEYFSTSTPPLCFHGGEIDLASGIQTRDFSKSSVSFSLSHTHTHTKYIYIYIYIFFFNCFQTHLKILRSMTGVPRFDPTTSCSSC